MCWGGGDEKSKEGGDEMKGEERWDTEDCAAPLNTPRGNGMSGGYGDNLAWVVRLARCGVLGSSSGRLRIKAEYVEDDICSIGGCQFSMSPISRSKKGSGIANVCGNKTSLPNGVSGDT